MSETLTGDWRVTPKHASLWKLLLALGNLLKPTSREGAQLGKGRGNAAWGWKAGIASQAPAALEHHDLKQSAYLCHPSFFFHMKYT